MKLKSLNLRELQKRFVDEEACVDHLFKLRWPDGYVCPRCNHRRFSFHSKRRLYQCGACKYQTSVTAGTIFHKTRTPLVTWFWMIFLMTRQKSGVSTLSLQRMLGIKSYKTAWTMAHKIRKAMSDRDGKRRLEGFVAMNVAMSKQNRSENRRIKTAPKESARILISMGSRREGTGAIWMVSDPAFKPGQSVGSTESNAVRKSDEFECVTNPGEETSEIDTGAHELEPLFGVRGKRRSLNWLRALVTNLKGNIRGVHHGVSKKHLDRYLGEFSYRFNRRLLDTELFNRSLVACVSTSTVTFAELKA